MYLIAYDIEDDRTRTKTANQLLAAGCIRLQKSVFAGDLSPHELRPIKKWLEKNTAQTTGSEDKILILNIGPAQLKSAQWIGKKPDDWELLAEPPDVIFI